jgi:hypothetical protein
VVRRKIQVETINLELTEGDSNLYRMSAEVLLVLYILFTAFGELGELIKYGGDYFESFWNYVDLLNVTLYLVAIAFWLNLLYVASAVSIPNKFNMVKYYTHTLLYIPYVSKTF